MSVGAERYWGLQRRENLGKNKGRLKRKERSEKRSLEKKLVREKKGGGASDMDRCADQLGSWG